MSGVREWVPRKDLPAEMPLREHIRHQIEDRNQTATLRDDVASANARNRPDLHEAIENSLWLVSQADPRFERDFENHD